MVQEANRSIHLPESNNSALYDCVFSLLFIIFDWNSFLHLSSRTVLLQIMFCLKFKRAFSILFFCDYLFFRGVFVVIRSGTLIIYAKGLKNVEQIYLEGIAC